MSVFNSDMLHYTSTQPCICIVHFVTMNDWQFFSNVLENGYICNNMDVCEILSYPT